MKTPIILDSLKESKFINSIEPIVILIESFKLLSKDENIGCNNFYLSYTIEEQNKNINTRTISLVIDPFQKQNKTVSLNKRIVLPLNSSISFSLVPTGEIKDYQESSQIDFKRIK